MPHLQAVLATHPQGPGEYGTCIEACLDCAATCRVCADACLGEEHCDHLRDCIRLDLSCAAICESVAKLLIHQTARDAADTRAVLEECAELCDTCGTECESHAGMHEHCRICAEACRECANACREALR